MQMLWSTCLLLALLVPVAALWCKTCFDCGKTCRDENTRTVQCAPDQDTCIIFLANNTVYDFPFNFTYKGCSRSQECESIYYAAASVANKYGQFKTQCCQTDECNAQDVQLPDRSSLRHNGLQCPGFVSTSNSHYGPGTVQCVGTEDQCVEVFSDLSPFGLPAKQIYFKGCGNQNVCSTKPGAFSFGGGLLRATLYNVNCYSAKGSCKLHQTQW